MNEYIQILFAAMAFIPTFTFAIVSTFGGRPGGRLLKRLVAPLLFCFLTIGLSVLTHRFCAWFFLSIPAYILSTIIGYGGDSICAKLEKRFLWSLIRSLCALTFCLFTSAWVLLIVQTIVSVIVTMTLGTMSLLAAPEEESLINFVSVMFVPFMIL